MDFTSLCQFRQLIKGAIIGGNWIMLNSKRPLQIISFIEKQHLTEKRREKKVFWMTFNLTSFGQETLKFSYGLTEYKSMFCLGFIYFFLPFSMGYFQGHSSNLSTVFFFKEKK